MTTWKDRVKDSVKDEEQARPADELSTEELMQVTGADRWNTGFMTWQFYREVA